MIYDIWEFIDIQFSKIVVGNFFSFHCIKRIKINLTVDYRYC